MADMFTVFLQAPLQSQILTILALALFARCQRNK